MRHQGSAAENLDAAKQSSDRTRLPIRTAIIPLPNFEEPQRRTRPRTRPDLTPADQANGPFDTAGLTGQARAAAAANEQRWPRLPGVSRDRVDEFKSAGEDPSAMEELRQELSARCIQIADLKNVQQQQAAALLVARTAIESLEASVTSLQKAITQRENETAAAKQELLAAVEEKNAVSEKLEHSERELAKLMNKLLHLSTTLNDREVAIISAEERMTALQQELTAKSTQDKTTQEPDPVPAPVIEDDREQQRNEATERSIQFESELKRFGSMLAAGDERINKLSEANAKLSERSDALNESHAQFESRIKKLESTLDARDEQLNELKEAIIKLSDYCDGLTHRNMILESERKHAQEKLKSQTSDIKLLEGALLAGRKTAEQRIAELTGELRRERDEYSAAKRESATIRKEIALLVSTLATTTQSIQ